MAFGCVPSDGDVMSPHVFREGLRLNSDGHVELLSTVVKPWVESGCSAASRVAAGLCPMPHFREELEATSENFFESLNMWVANSPHCNPTDNFV